MTIVLLVHTVPLWRASLASLLGAVRAPTFCSPTSTVRAHGTYSTR